MPVTRWLVAGALVVAVAAGGPVPASAAPAAPTAGPSAVILTVASDVDVAVAARSTTLTCDPVGGAHPAPAEACRTLAAVEARVDLLSVDPGPCTREYAPVTVTAHGIWRGRLVHHRVVYGNPCEARRATGVLYAF